MDPPVAALAAPDDCEDFGVQLEDVAKPMKSEPTYNILENND